MLVLFFLCMLCIHHHGHDHMTIVLEDACTVLFRTKLMSFWVPAADHEMKAWTWWLGVGFRACRWDESWQLKKSCRLGFQLSHQFFIQHNKNSFFGFVCQLIQQQHLKRLEVCFQIWEWFRSKDRNALYPYLKCPKCFSETINKNKQPLRLNYQYYKLSRITVWDPRKNLWYMLSCYY